MARSQRLNIHRVTGARLTDQVFEITLMTGEHVIWNVTKLQVAAKAGAFGPTRYARTEDLPPARWDIWDASDRATVEFIKTAPAILDEPAIAIAAPEETNFLISCFADGQHRITARQELRLPDVSFYIVPLDMERAFRVDGL